MMGFGGQELVYVSIALFLYFFPSVIAGLRRNKNTLAIFLLNFLLGWTVIGWVIALVWAVKK
ncbi:MAG TPA: superinfection immunity protein [Candidatus Omnitrophica bacterium]|nr:superinfection immunity protein [Candidatus Omnitrophota bacterium]